MTKVCEVMTDNAQCVAPEDTLERAAQWMDLLNVGSLPVCVGKRLVGLVTDRDITVRGTAAGLIPATARVVDVMSTPVMWCTEDQDTDQVLRLMGDAQVRRLPVVATGGELVGMVSIGDLATKSADPLDAAVREISTPSEPDGSPGNS
jgi:CBS domain-containing protein